MISSLHISNYALIDSLTIEFTPGLNIITGETGAGKSIMLGALSMLLGARSDSRAIRNAERKSVVEGTFILEGMDSLGDWAEENGIDWDPKECIMRREVAPSGRSRAFINDTPVNVSQLEELGTRLIDIHSQHQNQLLASAEYQMKIIDSMADNSALLERYRRDYVAWRSAEHELKATLREIERNRDDEEYLRFRLNQLEEADLMAGEQEDLESEREIQANMTQIKSLLTEALDRLTNGDTPALSALSEAGESIDELGEVLEGATELASRLETARVEIQDIAETLADYDSNLGADPGALERIEERLSLLYSLQSRFNVSSVESLIRIRNDYREKLSSVEDSGITISELEAAAARAKKKAVATACELTARRKAAAEKFGKELHDVASPLGMANLCCHIAVEPVAELLPTGADKVEFRFAFNKNQTPQPVGGAASGGEVSRLMLSIKSIVAGRLQLPTIVFDEVDTGVSGDVANRMGEMMLAIAGKIQVITITHLPQVAAKGNSHFKVFKEDDTDATHTRIRRLTDKEREGELALMLSGSAVDEAALANARSLLTRQ